MTVPAIGALSGLTAPGGTALVRLADTASTTAATGAKGVAAAGQPDFGAAVAGAIDHLSAVQGKADDLAVQAATGTLADVHDYTIAATEASLATELTVAVRNKAVEAFTQIMNLPL